MDERQKMAAAGVALIAAGVGLGIVGASLIVPAVVAWAGRLAEKGADYLSTEVEGASKRIGRVAGTLHRSFNEASKAAVGEFRRPA